MTIPDKPRLDGTRHDSTTHHKTRVFIMKIPISERALIARINRKLSPIGMVLKISRNNSQQEKFAGKYYTINTETNDLLLKDVNLKNYALFLGCLKEHEQFLP